MTAWVDPSAAASAARGWVSDSIAEHGDPNCEIFVAEVGGAVIGFVTVRRQKHFSGQDQAYVGELVVASSTARSGVGTALMRAAEAWAESRGLQRLSLGTGASNRASLAFFRNLGYREGDVRLSRPLHLGHR